MASTELNYQGISISTSSPTGYNSAGYTSVLSRAVDMGANTVALTPVTTVTLNTGALASYTDSLNNAEQAIIAAQAKGLTVFLKPEVLAYNPTTLQTDTLNDTRLNIPDITTFFSHYNAYIVACAALAEKYDLPLFTVGSEMLEVAGYTTKWEDIIASVRAVYSGDLTYAAASREEANLIDFWDKLDYVGVSVSTNFSVYATVEQLDTAWATDRWEANLSDLSIKTGKPIIFTDAAAPNVTDAAALGRWYESFMNTWAGSSKPDWLTGTFLWNHDPATVTKITDASLFDAAAIVVASEYGGVNYLGVNQYSVTGSYNDDRIELYGNAAAALGTAPVSNTAVTRSSTFSATVTIVLDGTIIHSQSPTVRIFINDVDRGTHLLSAVSSSDVDSQNITRGQDTTLTFQVDNLKISSIKVELVSPMKIEAYYSQVYIQEVTIDSTSPIKLNNYSTPVTYIPKIGAEQSASLGSAVIKEGGEIVITPANDSSYSTPLLSAPGTTASNRLTVNGNAGFDTVYALGSPSQYSSITQTAGIITLREQSGLHQNADLTNVEVVAFADGCIVSYSPTESSTEIPLATGSFITLPKGLMLSVKPAYDAADLQSKLVAAAYSSLLAAAAQPTMTVRTIVFTTATTAVPETVTVHGNAAVPEALVIDTTNLLAGTELDLNDVDFAVLTGANVTKIRGGLGNNTLYAGSGNQDILLGDGDDTLHGGDGDDKVDSTTGNDYLYGDAGNDTLSGGAVSEGYDGNDSLDGGDGNDTAVFRGNFADYVVSYNAATATYTLADKVADRDGTDSVTNVEHFQFADHADMKPADIYAEPDGGDSSSAGLILAGVGTLGLLAFFVL